MRARLSFAPLLLLAAAVAIAASLTPPEHLLEGTGWDPPEQLAPRPLAIAAGLELAAPGPVAVTGSIAWVAGADSTVKLGTGITVSGWMAGDTVRFQYFRRDTVVLTRRVAIPIPSDRAFTAATLTDSTTTIAPPYGVSWTYKGCAQVERGGRNSGVVYPTTRPCWTWGYTRPVPTGAIDSIWRLTSITIRPLGPPLGRDIGGHCAAWQAAHPDSSPFLQVNVRAVPACTDTLTKQLLIWQHCAFAELVDTAGQVLRVPTTNSKPIPYCLEQFESWRGEVSS